MCVHFIITVLSTIPAALSAEYPACDSSHWAFQLPARSISAKGESTYYAFVLFNTGILLGQFEVIWTERQTIGRKDGQVSWNVQIQGNI